MVKKYNAAYAVIVARVCVAGTNSLPRNETRSAADAEITYDRISDWNDPFATRSTLLMDSYFERGFVREACTRPQPMKGRMAKALFAYEPYALLPPLMG